MFKSFVTRQLEKYVTQYFAAHPDIRLVVVAGSVGKTSTKRAIGEVLHQQFRIRLHTGNHNTEIAAPLAILGIDFPSSIRNPLLWLNVFAAARKRIREPADVDVIIQEIGGDHPGDVERFGTYLKPDIAVVTAVTPEHMEHFKTIDAVAKEELSVGNYSKLVLINRDDIDGKYASFDENANLSTYGTTTQAEYRVTMVDSSLHDGMQIEIGAVDWTGVAQKKVQLLGEHSARSIAAAVAVGIKLGVQSAQILEGVAHIRPVPGRMNSLRGMNGTTVIDDTYNSSPAAARAALSTLYQFDSEPQRIAVLGSMNELDDVSMYEHQVLGELCNPDLLDWVVVVGSEAEKYLAPAARARGCQVKVCRDAIEAGEFTRSVTEEGAVILVKGSETGIYLEEAVKLLCNMTEDHLLVRQTPAWLAIKENFFARSRDNQS
jgi:UDP-N-acetylmuramoyl-tripeptide--D-alanyl-D-alanine ligase